MGQKEKLLEKIRNHPKSVRFEDMDTLLTYFGFERRQPRRGSSHYVYRRGPHVITIARHKPHIHSKTVKDALKAIDEIAAKEEQD